MVHDDSADPRHARGRAGKPGPAPGGQAAAGLPAASGCGLSFAFWGRVSSEDRQEPRSSRAWQVSRSTALIEPYGTITREFFDEGQSRSVPPQRRPEARKLLDALPDPDRGFDAVVIGEPQRAFYGNQFGNTMPLFAHWGVPLWVPEVGGPVDPDNEAHDLIMSVFGGLSKGERNRIRTRIRTAMAAQAEIEGRFLGGRAPYGYRLADAGPHPNPARAAEGRRLRVLAVDRPAAVIVRRIFAEYIGGATMQEIADALTGDAVPSPAAHARPDDPGRGSGAWSRGQVWKILTNPRYTGRQVWGRNRKHEALIDPGDVILGTAVRMRPVPPGAWIWSRQDAHPAIITPETFRRAEDRRKARTSRH